jgi:hypothetical protein
MSIWWTNRFWVASLDLNFFDFLKLFVKIRLTISVTWVKISYFLDLRIKSYGCLKLLGEVWAGWACAETNQQESTTCPKFWGRKKEKFLGRNQFRAPTRSRRATDGCPPPMANNLIDCELAPLFLQFLNFIFYFFALWGWA